ncbi:MAG: cytochrome c biogenesis protein [Candidatus Thermoplasmatota archaeon]
MKKQRADKDEKTRSTTAKRVTIIVIIVSMVFLLSTPLTGKSSQKAPDFTVETAEHEEFILSEQEDPVLIEFMSPLCTNCERLEENLREVHPDYEDDFVFLSLDISESALEDLRELKREKDIPWKVGQGDAEIFSRYQGTSVPKLVIVGAEGFIVFEETGVVSERTLEEKMDDVLSGETEPVDLAEYGIYGLAILGGTTSFFSPCSFPLLPSYFAYYLRPEGKEDKDSDLDKNMEGRNLRGLRMGLKTSLGMALVFGSVGALVILGGRWLTRYVPYLQLLVGGIILVSGFLILSDLDIRGHLQTLKHRVGDAIRIDVKRESEGHVDPFYYGLGYGMGAAGCTAPVFAAVLLASWLTEGLLSAFVVLTLYLLPMIVLMIVVSVLIYDMRGEIAQKLNESVGLINRISGIVLLAAGVALVVLFFF